MRVGSAQAPLKWRQPEATSNFPDEPEVLMTQEVCALVFDKSKPTRPRANFLEQWIPIDLVKSYEERLAKITKKETGTSDFVRVQAKYETSTTPKTTQFTARWLPVSVVCSVAEHNTKIEPVQKSALLGALTGLPISKRPVQKAALTGALVGLPSSKKPRLGDKSARCSVKIGDKVRKKYSNCGSYNGTVVEVRVACCVGMFVLLFCSRVLHGYD